MKILLDECVDWRLLRDLTGHDVKSVRQMGWSQTVNGAHLKLADDVFDVLITTDKNLSFAGSALTANTFLRPSS